MDGLEKAKDRLSSTICRDLPELRPLYADQWVINSLLQKSIRRGEVEVAQRAALTFLGQRGSAIWRRFMIIAFEDVGAASPDVVAMVVAACTDASWRKKSGGDGSRFSPSCPDVKRSHQKPLCRALDYYGQLSSFLSVWEGGGRLSLNPGQFSGSSPDIQRPHRSGPSCLGCIGWRQDGKQREDGVVWPPRSLLNPWCPARAGRSNRVSRRADGDAITLMVPLVWLAADQGVATELEVPRSLVLDGVPMYALDKHTRTGREAIRDLVKYNSEIRECLSRYVAPAQRHDAAYMAAFYADAAPLARKLVWRGSDELEALGTEADLLKVGVIPEGWLPCFRFSARTFSTSTRFARTPSAKSAVSSMSRPPSWPTTSAGLEPSNSR